jgi:hypothetical protein
MKKTATALLLGFLSIAFPNTALADTDFGLFPGVRFGLGRAPYRGIDTVGEKPGNGQSSWATFYEFHLDSILVFEDLIGVGVSGSYLGSSISNPASDLGTNFAYGGWGLTGVGMIGILPRLFLSARAGAVFGTVEAWNASSKAELDSTGLRFGGGITYAVIHNSIVSLGLSLNADRISSGKLALQGPTDVSFGATVFSLGATFALNMD